MPWMGIIQGIFFAYYEAYFYQFRWPQVDKSLLKINFTLFFTPSIGSKDFILTNV